MVVTRYSLLNVVLLVAGTLLCPFIWLTFTMGWGGDQPGFQEACARWFPVPELLSIPAFLIAYRWSGIACVSLWILMPCGIVLGLMSGGFWAGIFPITIQLIITGIATGITYWPIRTSWTSLAEPFQGRLYGHQQVTDGFLLGLAIKENGVLVTLDNAIGHLAGPKYSRHLLVLE